MAPLLTFRLPEVTFLERAISLSGKYMLFIGTHFEKGHPCWVVGVSNKSDGQITMRHYNELIPNCVAPRAQAYTYWEEFKSKMTEKQDGVEYEESFLEDLQPHLQKPN